MLLLYLLTTNSSIKCYNYEIFTEFGWLLNFILRKTTVILTIINLFECTIISCVLLSICLNNKIGIMLDFSIEYYQLLCVQHTLWSKLCLKINVTIRAKK